MRVETEQKRPYLADPNFKPIEPCLYLLAFEGIKTEKQYFEGIIKYADRLGINTRKIHIQTAPRSFFEEGCSNPSIAVPMLIDYLKEIKTDGVKIETLAKYLIDWAVLKFLIKRKNNHHELIEIKDEIVSALLTKGYSKEEVFDYSHIEKVASDALTAFFSIIKRKIKPEMYEKFFSYIINQRITGYKNLIPCFICDRDSMSFTEEAYDYICTLSQEKKIKLFISNPQFELWLLLHFKDASEIDTETIKNNPSSLLDSLKENGVRNPKNVHFERYYLSKVNIAIENSASLCKSLQLLKTEIGTNVSNLLQEFINTHN